VADLVLRNVGPYNMRFGFVYGTFTVFMITAELLACGRTGCRLR
jgi:hypothetical protein